MVIDVFKKVYDSELINSLIYTDDYENLKKISNIADKILIKQNIDIFLSKIIELYEIEGRNIFSCKRKDSLLSVLQDIRFNYKFSDSNEKHEIIDKINRGILSINGATVCACQLVKIVKTNGSDKEIIFDIEFDEKSEAFKFPFMYYYGEKQKIFEQEGIPYFIFNCPYYIDCLCYFIDIFPELLENSEFLFRTKLILLSCLELFKEQPILFEAEKERYAIKKIRKFNKYIKK